MPVQRATIRAISSSGDLVPQQAGGTFGLSAMASLLRQFLLEGGEPTVFQFGGLVQVVAALSAWLHLGTQLFWIPAASAPR